MDRDDIIPTPPVIETSGYVGPERRSDPAEPLTKAIENAVSKVQQGSQPKGYVDAVIIKIAAGVVVGTGILMLLLIFSLKGTITDSERDQRKFRDSVSCFIIEVSKQTPPNDILVKCHFVSTPGNN